MDNSEIDPPPGWRRVARADGTNSFVHDQVSGQEFWYPIPIGIGDGRALRSRYLHCKTRHAKLHAFPDVYRAYASGCAILALRDRDGNFAGCLRLNSYKQNATDAILVDTWQLIELSAGSVVISLDDDLLDHPFADVFDEWSLPLWKRDEHGSLYEFYNVMHVEWISPGIASRLAVGRVQKRAWEDLAVEDVEVSIG